MYWPMQLIARWLGVRLEGLGNTIVLVTAILVATALNASAGLAGLALTSALNMTQQLNWMCRNISDLEVRQPGESTLPLHQDLVDFGGASADVALHMRQQPNWTCCKLADILRYVPKKARA